MPEIVLITTTINVPHVLKLYRRYGPDVPFIIAGDLKSPHEAIMELLDEIQPAIYLEPRYQERYECSEHIGWNCIQRRNIALLEAIKMRPKVIVTIDDDNIPLCADYFGEMYQRVTEPYHGRMATNNEWFNIGDLIEPRFCHRGFPTRQYEERRYACDIVSATDCKIGIWEGLWLGDPDVGAAFRVAQPALRLLNVCTYAIAVDKRVYAPINTQNTAAIAVGIAPTFPVFPGVGRYDDIWPSYIAQRIMWENDYYVGYGAPFCWQERNPHSLERDLRMEAFGDKHTEDFCLFLRTLGIPNGDIIGQLQFIYERLGYFPMPEQTLDFCAAWLRDLEKVL